MATTETVYTVRAQAKDFDKVGQAVEKLNQQIRNGPARAMGGGAGGGGAGAGAPGGGGPAAAANALDQKLKDWRAKVQARQAADHKASEYEKRNYKALADLEAKRTKGIDDETRAIKKLNQAIIERNRLLAQGQSYESRKARLNERFGRRSESGVGGGAFGGGGGGGGPDDPFRSISDPDGWRKRMRMQDDDLRRGAFKQGLLQSLVPQAFIERGPGMYRQAAGNLLGQGIRGFGHAGLALLGSSITGSQSLVNAAASLPYGLGALASPVSSAVNAGNQLIQTRRGMSAMMPFMYRPGEGADPATRLQIARVLSHNAARGLGMSTDESVQALAQGATGTGITLNRFSQLARAQALQAQTAYGIDPGASLSLARGEMVGAGRAGGGPGVSMLTQAISDARRSNLEGVDIGRYVEQIAQRLEQFDQTGIKVSSSGVGGVNTALGALTGATGRRLNAMGQGFAGAVQNISENGPQGADQMALLRAAGFDPRRRDSYYEAMAKLEDPEQQAEILRQYEQDVRARGANMGRYQRAAHLRKSLRSVGIMRSRADALGDLGRSVPSKRKLAGMIAADRAAAMQGDQDMADNANMTVFGSTRIYATQLDQEEQAGEGTINANQRLDSRMRSFTLKVVNAGHKLADFARKAEDIASTMTGFGGSAAAPPQPRSAS